ncbi:MAG: signal recognition particle-docking protein FtsY [Epulopiscium sp.]|mgnify:CR=1 FL=1|nr:signal recognition particle-docking protein FtsY [Candidatus Epulonipiscium sp.]
MNLFSKWFRKDKDETCMEEKNIFSPIENVDHVDQKPKLDEKENQQIEDVVLSSCDEAVNMEDLKESNNQPIISPLEPKIMELEQEEKETKEKQEHKKKGFFATLVQGLTKTRENILGGVDQVLKSFQKIDEELFEELEEALIMADIGVPTTMKIIESLREEVKKQKITNVEDLKRILSEIIADLLQDEDAGLLDLEKTPMILLVIGVNGVGKTTTIGKLAYQIKSQDKKVLLAAADTFRAAAIDQLKIWGNRAGVDVIHHQEGSDPGAVIYDAIQAAKSRKVDVLICDTAGRLHNKKNLMEELKKLFRIINREYPEAKKEVLLVLDSTTGQNALQQAKLFKETTDITGIILTKLDGTAKGGIVLAIKSELGIPVKYIGVGEGMNDLQPFNSKQFSQALFNDTFDNNIEE